MRRAIAALVALAACASAQAYTPIDPGKPVWPSSAMTYHMNAQSFLSHGLDPAGVANGFQAWTNDPIATIVTTRGTDVTSAPASNDSINTIYYEASSFSAGSQVLAVTEVGWIGSTIVEADMTFNGVNFSWREPATAPCSNSYDIQSVATHESGHALGMGHSSESPATCDSSSPQYDAGLCAATMYYAGGPCDTSQQSLECDDLAGIRDLYPPGGVAKAELTPQAFAPSVAPGTVAAGTLITVTGTALNAGSLASAAGTSALYADTSGGALTNRVTTQSLAAVNYCHSAAVSLSYTFTPADAGTRWLDVSLDDGGTTPEYDESNNVVQIGPYTVTAPNPVLHLSTTTLSFAATVGQAAPPGQPVTVTNTGGGTLSWSVASDSGWLSATPGSGAQGTAFTANVSPGALGAGIYTGHLTVTATGATSSPQQVTVTLTVSAGPVLSVTPGSLTFAATPGGALPASKTLSVANTGAGTLAFTAGDDAAWLDVGPASGNAPAPLTVSVNTTAMTAGTYTGHVTVTSSGASGSPATITVTYTLTAAPAVLSVQPTTLTFAGAVGGSAPAAQAVDISNTGAGTLSFTVSPSVGWLHAAPASGNAPTTLSVTVDPTGLGGGSHSGSLTITAAGATGSPATVTVSYTLTSTPSFEASPTALTFAAVAGGADPAPQSLTIRNAGAGNLNYSVTDDAAWLSVAPTSGGLAAGAQLAHQVTASVAGLASGTYHATITLTAPSADNSPKLVPVTFNVTDTPPLSVTPATLTFTASTANPAPAPQSIQVATSGQSSASWTATADQAWLSVAPAAGTGDATLSVTVSPGSLGPGTYGATVTVVAPGLAGSPGHVLVSLTIHPGPRLSVSPTSTSWTIQAGDPIPAAQTFSVSNAGAGSLSWSVSGAPTWLSVAPTSGPGPGTFDVRPATTNLAAGRYTAHLFVSAPGAYASPQQVTVTLIVQGPALVLTPPRVAFDVQNGALTGAPTGQVSVSSSTAGALDFTARVTVPWLSVSPPSGSTPGSFEIMLTTSISGLEPGVHDGAIILDSSSASNAPALIPVSLVVRGDDAPVAWPPQVALDAGLGQPPATMATLSLDEASMGPGSWTLAGAPSWLTPHATHGATGDAVPLDVDVTGLAAGVHSGTLTMTSGNGAFAVPVSLTVHAGPAFQAMPTTVSLLAPAGGVSGHETISVASVGTAPVTFTAQPGASWVHATGGTLSAPGQVSVWADAAGLQAGTQVGFVTLGGATGESVQVAVHLTVVPSGAPVADFNLFPSSGCAPLSVTASSSTSPAATTLTYTFDDGTTAVGASATHVLSLPGTHSVTLTATNALGSSSRTREVVVRQPPLAFAGLDRTVAFEPDGDTSVVLSGARVSAAAPARIASVAWTTSLGTFADTGASTSSLERPTLVAPTSRGGVTATLHLAVADDAGCLASDTATVTFQPDFDADGDTVAEFRDNCPGVANASQSDFDHDGVGDSCDNCPAAANSLQVDTDRNGTGDVCDTFFTRSLALHGVHARACDGEAALGITAASSSSALVRLATFDLSGPRAALAASTTAAAAAAGGVAVPGGALHPTRVELRVPAGIPAAALAGDVDVPVMAGDAKLTYTCVSGVLDFTVGEAAVASCAGASVVLHADGDIVPIGAPDGRVTVADVVALLRAAAGLDVLDADRAARADLAPGTQVGTVWTAHSDCALTVADVVVALRAASGAITP